LGSRGLSNDPHKESFEQEINNKTGKLTDKIMRVILLINVYFLQFVGICKSISNEYRVKKGDFRVIFHIGNPNALRVRDPP
jgi:mRNA-degrading endonuclease RelE of RelBE toxin-antitoxin system